MTKRVAETITAPVTLVVTDLGNASQKALAKDPACPPHVLIQLAGSKLASIRAAAASNSNLPIERLDQLAVDSKESVRLQVAYNRHCPPDLLTQLAADPVLTIRKQVAAHPATPIPVLEMLATYRDAGSSVAGNPNCPATLLDSLAIQAIDFKMHLEWDIVLAHPNSPPSLFVTIARHPKSEVRTRVAAARRCPPVVLAQLACDTSDKRQSIRRTVAANPNTSGETLMELLDDNDICITDTIKKHPNCPEHIRVIAALG